MHFPKLLFVLPRSGHSTTMASTRDEAATHNAVGQGDNSLPDLFLPLQTECYIRKGKAEVVDSAPRNLLEAKRDVEANGLLILCVDL